MPGYLRTALNHFSPDVPTGWAYTLETTRNGRSMVERFDPSRPAGGQWTLLQLEGRSPSTEEFEKYAQSRPSAGSGGMQANFQRADIEPGSLKLISEDATRARFLGEFRAESAGADKMLAHLAITLTVNKALAYVEAYLLELKEPYWPVLTVKMNTLEVEATFSEPSESTSSLPVRQESHFVGRVLLISTEERLKLIYREFRPVSNVLSR